MSDNPPINPPINGFMMPKFIAGPASKALCFNRISDLGLMAMIGVGGGSVVHIAGDVDSLCYLLDTDVLIKQFQALGEFGVLAFILAHVIAAIVGLPGTLLVVVGGALFGVIWGTLWSVIGATLGAIAAFLVARYLMRDWVERRFKGHRALRWLNQTVNCNALICVMTIRFAPISPFNVINFLFGLTSIPIRPYAMGTAIGIIPGTLAYTWLGETGHDALHGENLMVFWIAAGFLIGLSLLPTLVRRQTSVQKH